MNQTNIIPSAVVVLIGIVIIGCSKQNTQSYSEDGEESGFDGWTAHPEVGEGEQGGGEHD